MKVFVRNLPYSLTDADLHEVFQDCGEIISARVALDRETGQSRGFGFVEFASAEAAQWAIESMNGLTVRSRAIAVCESLPRPR